MPIRVLAVLTDARTAQACLQGAVAAAAIAADARIEALHVKVDPDKLVRSSEEIDFQRVRERFEGSAEDRARAVRGAFDHWIASLPASSASRIQWREDVGAEQDKVIEEARDADLLVMARPHNMDGGDAMHAALFEVRRPLLVPSDWSAKSAQGLDRHMLIAWKASPQAKDAVEGAAPWLRHAAKVTLVMIAEDDKSGGRDEAEHLLRDVGAEAEIVRLAPAGHEPAEQILGIVHELKASALVMGAYRHNDAIEWALGGTTRHVLAKVDVPLFLAH